MDLIRKCNLCSWPLVKISTNQFGLRCLNCRSTFIHRAMGEVLINQNFNSDLIVHEFSAHGAIFKWLRKKFSSLTYSEYFDSTPSGEKVNGIPCQNLENLSLPNCYYDLCTSTEVFEHVAHDALGFKEVCRILKTNGQFIFTVPLEDNEETIERAIIRDKVLVHLLEPEYHGDHLRNKGILAFRNYGLDIKKRLLDAGFSKVIIHMIENKRKGIFKKKVVQAIK